jgi:hypothetical protein
MDPSTNQPEGLIPMAQHTETRTIHTIHIDLQDDTLAAIAAGDEVEVMLHSRTAWGRTPRPYRLSYSMVAYLTGANNR